MKTKILTTSEKDIREAAKIIEGGGLVAFPTETVYGLGANALDAEAVARIYEAKGRPSDNPMIVHIARASDIGQLTPMLSEDIVKLIDNFWPGPLTICSSGRSRAFRTGRQEAWTQWRSGCPTTRRRSGSSTWQDVP